MGVKRLRDLPSFIAWGRGGGGGSRGVAWFQGIREGLVTANTTNKLPMRGESPIE